MKKIRLLCGLKVLNTNRDINEMTKYALALGNKLQSYYEHHIMQVEAILSLPSTSSQEVVVA